MSLHDTQLVVNPLTTIIPEIYVQYYVEGATKIFTKLKPMFD